MPQKVHKKMEERSRLRRSRRYRKKRRGKKRFDNRKRREGWIAPSQLAKVQFRIKIVRDLVKIFPINYIAVEDVRFNLCLDFTNPSTSFVKSRRKSLQEVLNEVKDQASTSLRWR